MSEFLSEKHFSRNITPTYVLVIHGGAGTMSREGSTEEQQKTYRVALTEALKAGYEVLKEGGEALDAAIAAVVSMEDNPLFNAGKGAVFNSAGKNELETSIAVSKPPSSHPYLPSNRICSSLTLLTRVKNPSKLARAVYLSPEIPHPFLSGPAAEEIAEQKGVDLVDPSYFWTERRWREHRRGLGLPEEPLTPHETGLDLSPKGTVGAIALDIRGCICAVTSTGGRTNKIPGRIGDTPVMGAGFWAGEWNVEAEGQGKPGWISSILSALGMSGEAKSTTTKRACGISGTGDGDFFIRQSTAHSIAARMQLLNEALHDAASKVIQDLAELGGKGTGGAICLDGEGNVSMPLNSTGMYRGVIRGDGVPKVAIFWDEEVQPLEI